MTGFPCFLIGNKSDIFNKIIVLWYLIQLEHPRDRDNLELVTFKSSRLFFLDPSYKQLNCDR